MQIERITPAHPLLPAIAGWIPETAGHDVPAWRDLLSGSLAGGDTPAYAALADGRPVALVGWEMHGRRAALHFFPPRDVDDATVAGLLPPALSELRTAGVPTVSHLVHDCDSPAYEPTLLQLGFGKLLLVKLVHPSPADVQPTPPAAGFHLRPYAPGDLPAVAEVFGAIPRSSLDVAMWPQFSQEPGVRQLLSVLTQPQESGRPPASFVAQTDDGQIVGYALGRLRRNGEGYLGELGVAPNHHGRGLGQALLAACLAGLAAAGAPVVHLTVEAGNAKAASLYARAGFQQQGAECVFVWKSEEGAG